MVGLLKGFFTGKAAALVASPTSSEQSAPQRADGATVPGENGEANASFLSILVQMVAAKPMHPPEHVVSTPAERHEEPFVHTMMKHVAKTGSQAFASSAPLDTLVAEMVPVASGDGDVETVLASLNPRHAPAANTQHNSRHAGFAGVENDAFAPSQNVARQSDITHQIRNVAASEAGHSSSDLNTRSLSPLPVDMTERDETPLQAANLPPPARKTAVSDASSRVLEGFPLDWNKLGADSLENSGKRYSERNEAAAELQRIARTFSVVSAGKNEQDAISTQSKEPTGYIRDRSDSEVEAATHETAPNRNQIRDNEVTTPEAKANNQQAQSPSNDKPHTQKPGHDDGTQRLAQPVIVTEESLKVSAATKVDPNILKDEASTLNDKPLPAAEENDEGLGRHETLPDELSAKSEQRVQVEGQRSSKQETQGESAKQPVIFEVQPTQHQSRTDSATTAQAGTKSAAATHLPENFAHNLVVRISNELKAHIEGKSSEIRVIMKPESMGQMSLRVSMEDGMLTAIMDVSKPAVKVALEAQLPQLREALALQGINIQRFDIVSRSAMQFEHSREGNGFQRRSHSKRRMDVEVAERFDTVRYLGYNTVEYII